MAVAGAAWGEPDRKVGPSRLRSHLGYLITTVVSLHVAGAAWMSVHSAPSAPSSVHPPTGRVIHLRLQSTGGAPQPSAMGGGQPSGVAIDAAASPRPGWTTSGLSAGEALSDDAGSARPLIQHEGAGGQIPAEPEAAEILARAENPPVADDAAMLADLQTQSQGIESVQDGANEYLPRPVLTLPPQTVAPVIVDFPLRAGEVGRYATVLALFIDESGAVRRIRVDGQSLPEPFEAAARRSFVNARFRPGQLHGQVVKSLVRVEVVFDSTPIDVAHGSKSLSFSL